MVLHRLQIFKEQTTTISLFEANFGRKSSTTLSKICTTPNFQVSRTKVLKSIVQKNAISPDSFLSDKKCINGYSSDIEVEKGMTKATRVKSERKKVRMMNHDRFSQIVSAPQTVCLSKQSENWPESSWEKEI